MNKPNLGVVYCANNDYVMPTCISLCSVLENNRKAPTNEQVELSVHIFAEKWTDASIQIITEMVKKYSVDLFFYNPEKIIEKLQKLDPDPWCGTYSADVRLYVAEYIDVDYNICCLDSDVVMNKDKNLYELALFDFEKGKKSCASTIDMQSSPIMKRPAHLTIDEHICNTNGIFLLHPKLYKLHKTLEIFEQFSAKRCLIYKPYKNMLRNAIALKNEIAILPMKYQVYPGQKLLNISHWFFIFALKIEEYYTIKEIKDSLKNPVFIHFVNFIVNKPWMDNLLSYFPYKDIWMYYQSLTVYNTLCSQKQKKTFLDYTKVFFYRNLRLVYVFLCSIMYRLEVYNRNKQIRYNIKKK